MPRQDQLTLAQRNLYILPTRAGWSFGVVVIVLLLASINEQINLGYGLSFLLGGAGMAALYQTHGNLQGVSLTLSGLHSVHAGQVLRLPVALSNQHRRLGRYGLQVSAGTHSLPQFADLLPAQDGHVEMDVPTQERGWLSLPRLTIETRYPLGLFRAWAHWRPRSQALIWPALEAHAPALPDDGSADEDEQARSVSRQGLDQPEGLRDYRRGDPMRWIAWKKSSHALAAGTGLVTREPAASRSPDRWLDFERSPGLNALATEARLSRLATWLIMAEQEAAGQGRPYGLRLPGRELACNSGPAHLKACLDSLATWSPAGHTGARP